MQPSLSKPSQMHGFTLVEAMVVVAIVAIITSIAIPSYRNIMVSSRIRTSVNDFSLSLSYARQEALRRNTIVTMCPSTNGSSCTGGAQFENGWIVKLGLPANAGALLQDYPGEPRVVMTVGTASGRNFIFLPNGSPIGNFAGESLTVLENSVSAELASGRYLCISRTGRVRVFTNDQFLALTGSNGCSS